MHALMMCLNNMFADGQAKPGAANITAAKAAVAIDNAKAQQLTKAALAYATHALAEARRAQQ